MSKQSPIGSTAKTQRTAVPDFSTSELRQGEQLSEFIHRIGHEIGNPLTSIISLATIIPRLLPEQKSQQFPLAGDIQPKMTQYANSILDEAWRINGLSQRVVLLLSSREGNIQGCDVARVLRRSIEKLERQGTLDEKAVDIKTDTQDTAAQIDPDQLQALFAELLTNAVEAQRDLSVDRSITVSFGGDDKRLELEISNRTAKPIEGELAQLFKPFSSQQTGRNLGLGLTVAMAIIERSGGSISLREDTAGDKFSFTVRLSIPRALSETDSLSEGPQKAKSSSSARVKQPVSKATLPTSQATVLIVDDEESVASAIERILGVGLEAECRLKFLRAVGTDAMEQLAKYSDINVILCDLQLHDTSGIKLYERIVALYPQLRERVVFLTGDREKLEEQMFIATSGCACLAKPFEAEQLLEAVRHAINRKMEQQLGTPA